MLETLFERWTREINSEVMPAPDRLGPHGSAWRCDIGALRRRLRIAPRDDATIAAWIIEARWAHTVWHSYYLPLIHLRPMPNAGQTIFHRDGASHEFWLMALDPAHPRAPAVRGVEGARHLTPANFAAQLVEPSDEAAIARIETAIDAILARQLNPDTDARHQWEAMFGNEMVRPEARAL